MKHCVASVAHRRRSTAIDRARTWQFSPLAWDVMQNRDLSNDQKAQLFHDAPRVPAITKPSNR